MPRNLLELKRKTHVLARAHIRRFAHDEKKSKIYVYDRRAGRLMAVHVDVNGLFNVDGVWSHQAENLMERIEGAFWSLLDELDTSGRILDQDVISEYFSLWYARAWYSQNYKHMLTEPLPGITPSELKGEVNVIKGEEILTVTQEELLEYRGVGFYSADLQASLRSSSWAWIRCLMDKARHALRGVRWGLVECREMSLILPDRATCLDIPIGPQTFLHGYKNGERYLDHAAVPSVDVQARNQDLFSGALHAVVAHSREVLDRLVQAPSSG